MTEAQADRIENAAQALFELGLTDHPHGVLTAGSAETILENIAAGRYPMYPNPHLGDIYAGLDFSTPEGQAALREFVDACKEANQIDLCI